VRRFGSLGSRRGKRRGKKEGGGKSVLAKEKKNRGTRILDLRTAEDFSNSEKKKGKEERGGKRCDST